MALGWCSFILLGVGKSDNNSQSRMSMKSQFDIYLVFDIHRHCQSYKSKFIDIAKETNQRTSDSQPEITFHAISCSVYHWVCVQNKIKGFPTIVAFKTNSAEPHILKDPSPDDIADAVGVHLRPLGEDYARSERSDDEFRPVDILGASVDGMVRTKEATYVDAALSFIYALKTEVFTSKGSYLDSDRRETFSDWIDLLYWALPPTWILHTLINDIRNNIDAVMTSEENLMFIVEKHVNVVTQGQTSWSQQCSNADGMGYSCGLWSLFHIISIGVIERHKAVLGARDQISTAFVAHTMRNYVEHFFACESCQQYFLGMYDSCGFKHCTRLKQSHKSPRPESWNQLALWLWEVHNDVNMKVLEAEAHKEGTVLSKQEKEQFVWPSNDVCRDCKDSRGRWDMEAVLSHLKKQYWPGGVQNFRYIVLKKKVVFDGDDSGLAKYLEDSIFVAIFAGIIMWCSRKRYISFTGKHKKIEQDYV